MKIWAIIALVRKVPGLLWHLLPRWLSIPLLIVMLYVSADTATRLPMSDQPTMAHYEGSGPGGRALVALGGAGSSPAAQFSSAIETFKAEADDVFVPEYAPDLFDADKVIDLVIESTKQAKGYNSIVFVGASMGGLLAHDTIKEMRARGDPRPMGVVLVDSPLVNGDVAGVPWPIKILANILNLGAITNQWFPAQFDRNAPAYIAPDANRAELEKLWVSYETWLASCWGDQGDYVFDHDDTQRLPGVKWHFVRSGADKFVGKTAKGNWEKIQGPMPESVVDKGEHIAFQNIPFGPGGYNNAMQIGIRDVALAA